MQKAKRRISSGNFQQKMADLDHWQGCFNEKWQT